MEENYRLNIEKYLASLSIFKSYKNKGIITDEDFNKAESFLAQKYCIKVENIYRLNKLIDKANTTNNIMAISLIACASVAAIGSFFFIRKRKEQN